MPRTPLPLVIDARPCGPAGPLAVELLNEGSVLDHLVEHAEALEPDGTLWIAVDRATDLRSLLERRPARRFVLTDEAPDGRAFVLRADRLYDRARLRRAYRRGLDAESAVLWRLDGPHGLAGAAVELERRRSYQPLGHYWALGPARAIARALAPTRVRPNAVTLAAAALFLGGATVVAFAAGGPIAHVATAAALALALVLDTADGHLARLQGTASAFGRWLDSWLDEVGDMALHAAAAWAAFGRTGAVGWLLVGMLYGMGKFVFVAATSEPSRDMAPKSPTQSTTHATRPARLIRLAGHADVRWHLWIVLAACGRLELALAAYAAYYPARALFVAGRKAVRHG
jgi:phosphatidylglycerophosphate synthase